MNIRTAITLLGMVTFLGCSHAAPNMADIRNIYLETAEWLDSIDGTPDLIQLSTDLERLTAQARTIAMQSTDYPADNCPPEELTARLSAVGSLVRAMNSEQSRRDDTAYHQVLMERISELREYTTGCVATLSDSG